MVSKIFTMTNQKKKNDLCKYLPQLITIFRFLEQADWSYVQLANNSA